MRRWAVAILDNDKGTATEAAHGSVGQEERVVAHGGDYLDVDKFAGDEWGRFAFNSEMDGTREAGDETIAGGDGGQLGDMHGERLVLRPAMNGGDLLADDEVGGACGLTGDDQLNGFGFDDDDEGGEGGHIGAALGRFEGAAHAVEADADGDDLSGEGCANAAFLDLAFEGGDG